MTNLTSASHGHAGTPPSHMPSSASAVLLQALHKTGLMPQVYCKYKYYWWTMTLSHSYSTCFALGPFYTEFLAVHLFQSKRQFHNVYFCFSSAKTCCTHVGKMIFRRLLHILEVRKQFKNGLSFEVQQPDTITLKKIRKKRWRLFKLCRFYF